MHSIKIKKDDLLSAIRGNLVKHREVVEEALAEYRRQAVEQLGQMIADAKAGKRIRRSLTLVEPMDQSAEYTSAIRKLEMSVEDVIEIDAHSFDCLVLDRWTWKNQWSTVNAAYSGKALPQE